MLNHSFVTLKNDFKVTHVYDPGTGETEAGRLEFKTVLSYRARLGLTHAKDAASKQQPKPRADVILDAPHQLYSRGFMVLVNSVKETSFSNTILSFL